MITAEDVAETPATVAVEGPPLQTFCHSFEQICAGEDPWIPLGNLLHQFFGPYQHRRGALVHDPLELPEQLSPEQLRWAVFCAAAVDYLCTTYEIPVPEWTHSLRYSLEEPWYYGIGADLPQVQEKLRATTPETFTRRNIFCGDRTFANKYEYTGRRGRRRIA